MKITSVLNTQGTDAPNADVFGLFRDYLRKGYNGRWVLIIDHADDFESLILTPGDNNKHIGLQSKRLLDYIPDCSHGSVLLTTRNKKVATRFADKQGLEQVLPLVRKESEQLVYQLLDTEQCRDGGIDELTEVLNHFPLAIVQATSFIRGNGITVQTYLQRYRENKHNALELFGHGLVDSDDSEAVTTTWMISFKQLQANNEYAADLFSLMAYLDHSEIPESLLGDVNHNMTGLQFEKACGELKAFSFISEAYSIPSSASSGLKSTPRLFNVQPIVQLVMRLWLQQHNQTTRWSDAALVAVSKIFPPAESSMEHWSAYEMYLPHVQAVLDHLGESTGEQQHKANLLHNVSWFFRVRGFHDTAERMGCEALAIQKQILGDENEATLASVHSLSRILFEQGKIEESEELQIPAIEICKRIFGNEHNYVLKSQGHLAAIRGVQGRYEEALELQESILETSERALGQCPATWLAMRDLAITLSYMDRKTEAEDLQQKVYVARRENLGEDHPETLVIMNDLATTYIEQSRFQEAEVLLMKVTACSKRILGERHPHTIAAYEELKEALKSQKKKTEQARRLEGVLRQIKREWKEGEENAAVRKRPNAKRTLSSSVITYVYRRPTAILDEADEDNKSEIVGNNVEGLGLGLTLTNSRSPALDESDEEDEDEDDTESEEFETIKKGLLFMMRGMMSLPIFNIVKVAPAEEPILQSTTNNAPQDISISTPQLRNIENEDSPAQVQPQLEASRSDTVLTTSSSDKPAYSNNKVLRTIEKKVERNINKETRDNLLKESMDLLETTKTKWRKSSFRDLKVSWAPKNQEKKDKEDEASIVTETEAEAEYSKETK
jgi:tetratricopeptide (TPR) repeat protein